MLEFVVGLVIGLVVGYVISDKGLVAFHVLK